MSRRPRFSIEYVAITGSPLNTSLPCGLAALPHALNAGSCSVDHSSDGIDLLLAERPLRKAQPQCEVQVFHRSNNLRCGATSVDTASLSHPSKKRVHGPMIGVEESSTLGGNLVQLLRPIAGIDRDVAELLKERQRWIDDARAGAVG